jgi:UDP-N-acetylmuramate--alanine ligase
MLVADPTIDLSGPRRVHVVGIGGAGMSAIASVLHWMGHTVSGSDMKDSTGLDRLRALGISVQVGHSARNIADVDLLTISTAIPDHNVEVRAAREASIPVHTRGEVLRSITLQRRTLAVAGTHGKTTTSSLLALILVSAGLEPSFIIGGDVNEIGTGAVWSEGDLFVVEADESDGTFLRLARQGAIVTNVEPDHVDYYGSVENLYAAFDTFVDETEGPVVVCADDAGSAALASRSDTVVTYGTSDHADYRICEPLSDGTGTRFDLSVRGEVLGSVRLAVPGMHNVRNAVAAAAMAMEVGASFNSVVEALARYAGVARRFEYRGVANGVTFIDDYAHLPTEVEAALEAAGSGDWNRIVCVFQPHRYSRTAEVWQDFANSFQGADLLLVTDIYSSGEAPRPGISATLISDVVAEHNPDADIRYLGHRSDVTSYLLGELGEGDLCLTLGAGDLTSLPDELQRLLSDSP